MATGLFESLSMFTPLLIFSISLIFTPSSAKLTDNPQFFIKLYHFLNAIQENPSPKIFRKETIIFFMYLGP